MARNLNFFLSSLLDRIFLGLFILCYFSHFSWAQQIVSNSFEYPVKAVFVDRLNHLYTVDNQDKLRKYLPSGRLFADYHNTLYGTPTSFDFTNPFQPLVYYGDLAKVVNLDVNLGTVEEFQLSALQLFDVDCISRSMDGNFWTFDKINSQFKKINISGKVLVESITINLIWPEIQGVDKIADNGKFVAALVKGKGIIVLDLFGNVHKKIILPSVKEMYFLDHLLYADVGEGSFERIDMDTGLSEWLLFTKNGDGPHPRIVPGKLFYAELLDFKLSIKQYE
jgi:hypothetical protein